MDKMAANAVEYTAGAPQGNFTEEGDRTCTVISRSTSELALDEIHGLLQKDQSSPFDYPHISFVKNPNDLPYESCPVDGCPCATKKHCALCVTRVAGRSRVTSDLTSRFTQLKRHMTQFHLNRAVKHKGWYIVTCNLLCTSGCHYHCPHCATVIKSVSHFEKHLDKCDKSDILSGPSVPNPSRMRKMPNHRESIDDEENLKILTEEDRNKHIGRVKDITGENYHLSMVCAFGDLKILKGADKRYRCPLCTDLLFPPTDSLAKVEKHFTTQHWFKKIQFKDIFILRCLLNCYELSAKSEESHWHCPLCPRFNMVRRRVEEHLQSHLKGTWHQMLSTMQKEDVDKVVYKTENVVTEKVIETVIDNQSIEEESVVDKEQQTENNTSPAKHGKTKPKEVFQMMAAVVDPDFLESIPGDSDFFFRKLKACLGINYTNAGQMCLIQGRLESVQQAQSVLEEIRQTEPHNESELDQLVAGKLGTKWFNLNKNQLQSEPNEKKSPQQKFTPHKGKQGTKAKPNFVENRWLLRNPKEQTKVEKSDVVSRGRRKGKERGGNTEDRDCKPTETELGEMRKTNDLINKGFEVETSPDVAGRRSVRKRKVNPHVEAFLRGNTIKVEPEDPEYEGSSRRCGTAGAAHKTIPQGTGRIKRKLNEENRNDSPKRAKRTIVEPSKAISVLSKEVKPPNDEVVNPEEKEPTHSTVNQSVSELIEGQTTVEGSNLDPDNVIQSENIGNHHSGCETEKEESIQTPHEQERVNSEINLSNIEDILNAEPEESDPMNSDNNPEFNVVFDEESGNYQLTMSVDSKSSAHVESITEPAKSAESQFKRLSKVDEKLRGDSRTVYTCPVCHKQFVALPKYNKHLVGTNCTNIMLRGEVKVPEDVLPLIDKAGEVGQSNECPSCKKKLYCIEAARVHYVEDSCAKQFHPKTNPYKFEYDERLGHFKCRHCTYSNASAFQVNLHDKRKHTDRTIHCKLCDRKFSTSALLRIHVQTSHPQVKKIVVCDICGEHVIQRYMKRHKESKHDPTFKQREAEKRKLKALVGSQKHSNQFKCSQCSYESYTESQVKNHEIRIHGRKTIMCTEEGCNKMFATDNDMKAHVKSVHQKIGNSLEMDQCPVCKKSMMKKNINQHVRQVHEKVRNFNCPICHISFGTKHVLRMHLETHKPHSDRYSKFLCPHCGKGFVNKISYQEHVNVHTGLRPYKCELCQKTYRHKSVFQRHMDSHKVGSLKKEHFCSFCGNGFCTKRSLYAHMKRHEGIEIECVCGQKFFSNAKMLLERHQSTCPKWQEILTQESEEVAVIMTDEETAEGTETILVLPPNQAPHSTVVLQTVAEDGTFEETEVLVDSKDLQDIQNVIDQYPQNTGATTTLEIDQSGALESSQVESQEKYQCGYCDSIFYSMDEVQEHMLELHVDSGIKVEEELVNVSVSDTAEVQPETGEVLTVNVVEGQDGSVMQQIVEQLEDGTVQILDQPVQVVDGEVEYITENGVVLEQDQQQIVLETMP